MIYYPTAAYVLYLGIFVLAFVIYAMIRLFQRLFDIFF